MVEIVTGIVLFIGAIWLIVRVMTDEDEGTPL